MGKGDGYAGQFDNEAQAVAEGWLKPVTVQNLLDHYNKYGLDNHGTGYKGRDEQYRSYNQLRADALVHVARSRLTEDGYLQVLRLVGYDQYEEQARSDWRELHEGQ